MRKIFLKLTSDTDLFVDTHRTHDGTLYWHLRNRGNDMCVITHGRLCKSIVRGMYILDINTRFTKDKLLSARYYANI